MAGVFCGATVPGPPTPAPDDGNLGQLEFMLIARWWPMTGDTGDSLGTPSFSSVGDS